MNTIKIQLSYSETIGGKIIQWFTNSQYSHVDIIFDKEDYQYIQTGLIGSRPGRGVILHNKRYEVEDIYEIKLTEEQEKIFWRFVLLQLGKNYDWRGIFCWFCPSIFRNWQNPDRWFCSELVAAGLKEAGINVPTKHKHHVSPEDLLNFFTFKKRKTQGTN